MRNTLMSIITFFLIVIIIVVMVKGITIGGLKIAGIGEIRDKSNILRQQVDDLNKLNNLTYKTTLDALDTATKNLATNKKNYLDVASVSSDSEIKEANQQQIYSMEYLWSKIGNHATEKGVNLKLEVNPSGTSNKNTLNFTVIGGYMGIRDFIYSLENDNDLDFKIESFKLTSGGNNQAQPQNTNQNATQSTNQNTTQNTNQGTNQSTQNNTASSDKLTCTFKVSNIAIKQENVTSTNTSTSGNNVAQNTTTNSTSTNTTANTTNNTSDVNSIADTNSANT